MQGEAPAQLGKPIAVTESLGDSKPHSLNPKP